MGAGATRDDPARSLPPGISKIVKTRASILTIETIDWGGIPTMVDAIYRILESWGRDVTVYRTRSLPERASRSERLWASLSRWQPERVQERGGLKTALMPTPPFPLWMHYLVPQYLFGPVMGEQQSLVVVSGSAHVALPLALRGIPYILWVATPYEDELRAKADAGDSWAQSVLHGPGWQLLKLQERYVLSRAVRVLGLSHATSRRLREIAPRAAKRIETMLFPIDTTRFKAEPEARQTTPYGDYLLFTARINDPRKNTAMLLRAFAKARETCPRLNLVLAGEDPDAHIQALTAELGLQSAVIFLGPVAPRSPELIRLYQGARLFVMPSLQEGLGISMLEAIACGAPVVATPCGGPEGLIIEGQTGLMTNDLHDHEAFAEAIVRLLEDPDERELLSQRCVAFAEQHFARTVVARQLQHAVEQAEALRSHPGALRVLLASAWAILIVVMYAIHQWALRGEAIRAQWIEPLLGRMF